MSCENQIRKQVEADIDTLAAQDLEPLYAAMHPYISIKPQDLRGDKCATPHCPNLARSLGPGHRGAAFPHGHDAGQKPNI